MNIIVNDTIFALAANATTAPFFNGIFIIVLFMHVYLIGARPTNSTDYTIAANAQGLQALLVQFFGAALGCSDGTVGPYVGNNLTYVHQVRRCDGLRVLTFNLTM